MGKRKRSQRKNPGNQAAARRAANEAMRKPGWDVEFRPENMHPSLRGMAPEDEINVIMTTEDTVPEGAGELLGILDVPQTTDAGDIIPRGAKVYRDMRPDAPGHVFTLHDLGQDMSLPDVTIGYRQQDQPPPGPYVPEYQPAIPAAFRQPVRSGIPASPENARSLAVHGDQQRIKASLLAHSRTAVAAADQRSGDAEEAFATMLAIMLEEAEPGLAERMAEGLGPEELQRLAPVIANAARKADDRLRMLEESDDRSHALIAGGDPGNLVKDGAKAEEIPVRTSWSADQVLDMHTWLARRYSAPVNADQGDRDLGDYLARLIRTAQLQAEDMDATARMFWPVDLGLGAAGPEEGEALARVIGHGLREARTYQVTGPMVARMRDVFRQVGLGIRYLDGGELPSHAGFAWMDQPWLIAEAAGYIIPFRAVSWEKITVVTEHDSRVIAMDAARIVMWTLIEDDVAFGRWDSPKRADQAASRIGRLMPQHVAVIPFDRQFGINGGFEEQGSAMLALIHILWAFLGMELSASRPVPPASPHTERRARRSLKHEPGVHVVTLRRVSYISEGEPGHRLITRTCRWWTDDFYRHIDRYEDEDGQGRRRRHEAVPAHRTGAHPLDADDRHDVCAVCLARDQTVRVTLVHGHFRGPTWLPVKPRKSENDTLYRLAR